MRMMIGLIILGILLLFTTFYYGKKYFDGTVVEKPYEEAMEYDKKKAIIKEHSISVDNISIATNNESYELCFLINGKLQKPLPVKNVAIYRPAGGKSIDLTFSIQENKVCSNLSNIEKGYYILKVFLNLEALVFLEKTIFVK